MATSRTAQLTDFTIDILGRYLGRRLCIGEEFAWMQGVSILASVARRFRLALVPGQTVVPEPNVTLRPRGGRTQD
jgi:cytochrome P450